MLTPLARRALALATAGSFQRITFAPGGQPPLEVGVSIVREAGRAAVVFTELAQNTGKSITDAAEWLANELHRTVLADLRPGDVEHFEHYGPASYPHGVVTEDAIERVTFQVGLGRYGRPRWTPVAALSQAA